MEHTGRAPPTVREQILWMLGSIDTADPLLIAHIAQINGDPTGKGMDFEAAATHLMLADPVARTAVKSKRKRNGNPSISALAGKGNTGSETLMFRTVDRGALVTDDLGAVSGAGAPSNRKCGPTSFRSKGAGEGRSTTFLPLKSTSAFG